MAAVIIGALMLLVPGLLITNSMRDIIYGDTSSGVSRIVPGAALGVRHRTRHGCGVARYDTNLRPRGDGRRADLSRSGRRGSRRLLPVWDL